MQHFRKLSTDIGHQTPTDLLSISITIIYSDMLDYQILISPVKIEEELYNLYFITQCLVK